MSVTDPFDTGSVEIVVWEDDPTRIRVVKSWCRRCFPNGPESPVMLLSPRGVAHHVSDHDTTDCGKDATGPDWWWRL
jgi:hypothetical protein